MSDLSAVKALVFDVFGTVVDWRSGVAATPKRPLHPALMRKTGGAGGVFVGLKSASAKAACGRCS